MSWSSDDDNSSTPPDDGAEDLRRLCYYLHITNTPFQHLKFYERCDGRPIVLGMDTDGHAETASGKAAWRRFTKNIWRNVPPAVERRRKQPKHHPCHSNSLPHDYSPFQFIRPRRSCEHNFPRLPLWTATHYNSQFNMDEDSDPRHALELLKSMCCQSLIGTATLKQIGGEVDDKPVDLMVKGQTNAAGQLLFNLMGVTIMVVRCPRGAKKGSFTYDVMGVSKVNGDTAVTTYDVVLPWHFSNNREVIRFKLSTSTTILQKYADDKQARVRDDPIATEARGHAEQAFGVELRKLPSARNLEVALEFPGVKFIPKALQDKRLVSADENAISCDHNYVKGLTTDVNNVTNVPFCVGGCDVTIAIDGRADAMQSEESIADVLSARLKSLQLKGMSLYCSKSF